ncbi:MAG: sugar transferase [Spirochaetes bacterium]|nr:sugar transferase [Spirochaetota bacterium]
MKLEKSNRDKLIINLHAAWDIGLTVAAFIGAYFIRKYVLIGEMSQIPNYYIILLLTLITMYPCFIMFNFYESYLKRNLSKILRDMLKGVTTGVIILMTLLFMIKLEKMSRIYIAIFYINIVVLMTISKSIIYQILKNYENREYNISNILIVGSRERARNVIEIIRSSPKKDNIMGCLEIDPKRVGKKIAGGVPVIGTMEDLKDTILTKVVDEIIFAMPLQYIENIDKYLLLIEEVGILVRIIPDWHIHSLLYKPKVASIVFDDFHGLPTMLFTPTTTLQRDLFLKNLFDYSLTVTALILLLPFFLLIGLMIKCISWGPVFFKQERVGLNGRKFMLYKFRTMVPDAEKRLEELKHLNEADGPVFKIKKDPRIIPFIGTLLRKISLDELPQLINILKGEMSLIGPRPPIQSEVDRYDIWQRRRLSMKPGLTCIWQISPNRNDIDFNTWMEMDLEYIDNWSLLLDAKLFLKTILVVFMGHGR